MTARVALVLARMLLALAVTQIASRAEATAFSDWMTSAAYDTVFEQKRRDGFYPIEVEAQVTPRGLQYRARFEPFPPAPFAYYSYHGLAARLFATRSKELDAQGYRLIWAQSVEDGKGALRYQATWIKGNGPAGFAPLAGGPETAAAPSPPPDAAPSTPPPTAAAAGPAGRGDSPFKVTYRVKGTAGSALLTFRDPKQGTVQRSAPLPWEVSFDASKGAFLYVSAQNEGGRGSVTCEIVMDGESRTVSTSTGAFVIAECSDMAERR